MRRIIQIAGIRDLDEARMLLSEGVDWLGFPFHLPVHQPDLSFDETRDLIAQIDAARCVLITYLNRVSEIVEAATELGVRKVQLHGEIEPEELRELKRRDPELFVIKSFIVGVNDPNTFVRNFGDAADAFLTDTYDPVSGATGATGKTHDWQISRELVRISKRPVILAGGLNAENVAAAIRSVNPFGLDAHTGVEDDSGRKDREKVRAFVAAVRGLNH